VWDQAPKEVQSPPLVVDYNSGPHPSLFLPPGGHLESCCGRSSPSVAPHTLAFPWRSCFRCCGRVTAWTGPQTAPRSCEAFPYLPDPLPRPQGLTLIIRATLTTSSSFAQPIGECWPGFCTLPLCLPLIKPLSRPMPGTPLTLSAPPPPGMG
jgi:hypothetical protein